MHRLIALASALALAFISSVPAQVDRAEVRAGQEGFHVVAEGPSGIPLTVRTTPYQVVDLRFIVLASVATRAVTWTELEPTGPRPYFALSLDGHHFHEATPATYELRLRFETFEPLSQAPNIPSALDANLGGNLWIVQFHTQTVDAWRAAVENAGGEIQAYLAHHAHVVRMDGAAAALVSSLPCVRWIGGFHPAYRLDDLLLQDHLRGHSRNGAQRVNIQSFKRGLPGQQPIAEAILALGGRVDLLDPTTHLMVATLDVRQIAGIARHDLVHFIDPWGAPENDMDIARQFHGAVAIETFGFDGTGVRGEVMDGGTQNTHPEFASPAPILHGTVTTSGGAASHGTSTYGIIFANGNDAAAKGVLHNGQGIAADYTDGNLSSNTPQALRMTRAQELVNPAGPYQAVFQSNSWGSTLTTQYTTISNQMDDIVFQTDLLILNSQSNAGSQNSRPQAWAKNVFSIGGISHQNSLTDADDVWTSASFGPAADTRIKPEIASFYDAIYTTNTTSAYTTGFGGTSGATPITAGMCGLFFQMWHNGIFGNATSSSVFASRPKPSTAKAFMINGATPWALTAVNTRYRQGWGRADVGTIYNNRNNYFIDNEQTALQNLQTQTYSLTVPSGQAQFVATLVWSDPPGTTSAALHRINNLNLRVTAPGGTTYWGNNGLITSATSTSGGTANSVDTVENVIISNPTPGTWTVEVIAAEVNQDGRLESGCVDQDYALVVRGVNPAAVPPGPGAACFEFQFSTVPGSGSVHVDVDGIGAAATQGYCVFSSLATGTAGGGSLFGLYPDVLSILCLTQPLAPGSLFHWTYPAAGLFPDVPFDLPAGSLNAIFPPGTFADGIAVTLSPTGTIVDRSLVRRVAW